MSDVRLCLIGMSGVGKSFWAKRLEAAGFARHDCDSDIARQLTTLVPPRPNEDPVLALGRWMGMPWSEGYTARAARYLELEEQVTRTAIAQAQASPGAHVLDATGSVIYLPSSLLDELRRTFHVVYLRASAEERAELLARYLREPKPVLWGNAFAPRAGETPEAALPRCYATLLDERDRRYLALAHVVLDAAALETRDPGVKGLLVAALGPQAQR